MRRKIIPVQIGNLLLSAEEPVMVQSMLNTSTLDTEACVRQAIRVIEAGGQLVRITAQGVKEAENLKHIRVALRAQGYDTPLSADIHFTPEAALVAAQYVEKVRINPGNFVDKRATFQHLSYTEEEYAAELARLREKFIDFLKVCREHHTAIRIGTNHGSLSDRIMSRYGDTPAGMVEATLEYLRICQETHFQDVVISLKSSDCRVMVEAVRLLVAEMTKEGMEYPLHLGVTEAGEGEDGRIRSAVGIGTLLNEGLGDTIRVSLTEAPEAEIPVARALVEMCPPHYEPELESLKRTCTKPVIVADLSACEVVDENVTARLGFVVAEENHPVFGRRLSAGPKVPELIYTETLGPELTRLPETTTIVVPVGILDLAHVYNRQAVPLYSLSQYNGRKQAIQADRIFVELTHLSELTEDLAECLRKEPQLTLVLALGTDAYAYRQAFRWLHRNGIQYPAILHVVTEEDADRASLRIASQVGGFFLDRLAAGLWISHPNLPVEWAVRLSQNILQSAGVRRYKTEFVSCPGCGRTLFDLQGSVARIKEAFAHLDKLKIAVMGCIVNGPGEMGDADYGYVGAGNGKVNLYKGKQIMKRAVPETEAIEVLEALIRENGDWKPRE